MITAEDITEVHRRHPEWSTKEIALHLGCSWGYVRKTFIRRRLWTISTVLRRQMIPGLLEARPKP